MTGVEPAPAYWIYADQDLKSCVLPLHYTRNILKSRWLYGFDFLGGKTCYFADFTFFIAA